MLFQWIARQFKLSIRTTALVEAMLGAVVLCFVFGGVATVSAQSNLSANELGLTDQVQTNTGLASTDIRLVVANIIRVAFGLLGVVFLIIVLYAGFVWMTAGGNDEKIASAKKIMFNGIIGMAVMLSAYAIVSFVISKLLGVGSGTGVDTIATRQEVQSNFFGSSALGSVIKDHYPARDQQNVPRNTRIIITFSAPVLASSFITDTNANGVLGDCQRTDSPTFDWDKDCDKLLVNKEAFTIKRSDTGDEVLGAAVLASGANGKIDTVVIRPISPLGSEQVPVQYAVKIGKAVLFDDSANGNPPILPMRPYEWQFTCSTELDTAPPRVVSVFPKNTAVEDKNSVVQINFSKPMDPTGMQGEFTGGNEARAINGNIIFLKINSSPTPAGSFRLINNYQTLEFTPTEACGVNACGGTVFCMPVTGERDDYQFLVRAANTYNATSFESVPFSGAADASGNALDGNSDGKVQNVPHTGQLFASKTDGGQLTFDNYFWKFTLKNEVDVAAPYIRQITPGPNAENVSANNELSLLFSKTMRVDPMYTIGIEEKPATGESLWHRPLVSRDNTFVRIDHGPFLTESAHYYYPVIDSRVQDVHFNCFYPAKGPNTLLPASPTNPSKASDICNADGTNCCAVSAGSNAFCCNGLINQQDKDACLNALKSASY